MPAEKIEIFKRECIIRNSSEIIITENGSAVLYKVSDNSKFMTSNIFAARIMEYAPQLHSYFVDIGDERRALLNAPEGAHRLGSFCAVQIAAAARGKKGACVTSGIRLTGVYAVLLPTEDKPSVNISTKIKDGAVRERLAAAGKLLQPKYALILRTQAASASAAEIAEEYEKLVSVWHGIQRRLQSAAADGASRLLFAEDPVASALLKYPLASYSEICADTTEPLERLGAAFPELKSRLRFLPKHIFAVKSVDSVKTSLLGRKVFLKSGADIVIEKTEALTVIDVNTGKSAASYKEVNFEAAEEIMRQLRLREIGGIILCDFIGMEEKRDGEALTAYMRELALRDPSRPEIPGMTALGLMEIARKRS